MFGQNTAGKTVSYSSLDDSCRSQAKDENTQGIKARPSDLILLRSSAQHESRLKYFGQGKLELAAKAPLKKCLLQGGFQNIFAEWFSSKEMWLEQNKDFENSLLKVECDCGCERTCVSSRKPNSYVDESTNVGSERACSLQNALI